MRPSPARQTDRGATLVLALGLVSAMVAIAALVVDLGLARHQSRLASVSADNAAIAGASALIDGDGQDACTRALAYVEANGELGASATSPSCTPFSGTCTAGTTPKTRTYSFDRGAVSITHPVAADDPLMGDQLASVLDQSACDRVGVLVTKRSAHVFATGATTVRRSAVAATAGSSDGYLDASLILLNETGCNVLELVNSPWLTAYASGSDAGVIAIDSDGSDCPASTADQNATIRVPGNLGEASGSKPAGLTVQSAGGTPGEIRSWTDGSGNSDQSYFKQNWLPDAKFSTLPSPAPARVGRGVVDEAYNSAASPLIDGLVATYSGGAAASPGPTFQRWTDHYPCSMSNFGTVVVPAGDWWVNCNKLNLANTGELVFTGGGDIVMNGGIEALGAVRVGVNCPSGSVAGGFGVASNLLPVCGEPATPTTLYVRSGDVLLPGDTQAIVLNDTFVYAETGTFRFPYGDKAVVFDAPNSGPFENLAFWAESSTDIFLPQNKTIEVDGIFFAPNATMDLRGSRTFVSRGGQVFLDSLHMEGSTTFETHAAPNRGVMVPQPGGSRLIR